MELLIAGLEGGGTQTKVLTTSAALIAALVKAEKDLAKRVTSPPLAGSPAATAGSGDAALECSLSGGRVTRNASAAAAAAAAAAAGTTTVAAATANGEGKPSKATAQVRTRG